MVAVVIVSVDGVGCGGDGGDRGGGGRGSSDSNILPVTCLLPVRGYSHWNLAQTPKTGWYSDI